MLSGHWRATVKHKNYNIKHNILQAVTSLYNSYKSIEIDVAKLSFYLRHILQSTQALFVHLV